MAKKDGPNWEGLLKWSLARSDGTGTARNLSEEDRKWFMEAMQSQSVDVIQRMKEITLIMKTPDDVLQSQGVTSDELEGMLDELQDHVESIDMANDLHSIGGLNPLLKYLKSTHANIRAKAAEVVSTVVQNNPRSQELVMQEKGLEPLLTNFLSDPDVNVRTKALGAISSLIRNNKPGSMAFRLGNGYSGIREALSWDDARFQRKALNLIHYLMVENSADCATVEELGICRRMIQLASSESGDVREAALKNLLEVATFQKDKGKSRPGDEDAKLKEVVAERMNSLKNMSTEEAVAAREEKQLVESLWRICYKEDEGSPTPAV